MLIKTNLDFTGNRKDDDHSAARVRLAVGDPNAEIAFGDGTQPNDGVYVVADTKCAPTVKKNLERAGLR